MASTKKTNPPAFGEILAELDAGADPAGSPAAPQAEARRAPAMDISWIQSARMRASAVQMAHRVAAEEEARRSDAVDRPRWKQEEKAGSAASEQSPSFEAYFAESDAKDAAGPSGAESAAARVGTPPRAVKNRADVPAGVGSNPVHALWRLLGQVPKGWRAGAGAVASALAAARPSRKQAEAPQTAASAAPGAPRPAAAAHGAMAQKSEDEAIAEELGLRADLAIVDLRRIRRDFAKKNHPDRFEPALRLGAARRMTIANMLIDAHMKQRPPSH